MLGSYVFTLSYHIYLMDVYFSHNDLYDSYEGIVEGPLVGYVWMACSSKHKIKKEFKKIAKKYWKEYKKKYAKQNKN